MYRIEEAVSGRSSCRECGKTIGKGEWRFGKSERPSRWFHLACAKTGSPRAFKPFADEAAAILAKSPTAVDEKSFAHDPDLARLLAGDPDDHSARLVFADQLMERGDVWGELISLAVAGKKTAVNKLRKKHAADLQGGFPARIFKWDTGFVSEIALDGRKPGQFIRQLTELLALRTTVLVRRIALPVNINRELAEFISQKAPASLRCLFTWYTPAIAELTLPGLEKLDMWMPKNAAPAPRFLIGEGLPKLRALSMYSVNSTYAFSTDFLRAFLTSPLLAQIEDLKLFQGVINDAGLDLMLEHANRLDHLKNLALDFDSSGRPDVAARFGPRLSRDFNL